jgi:hypothetical protein
MKIKWEYVFGGISAIAGVLYILKGDGGGTVVNNVPPLDASEQPSYVAGNTGQEYTSPQGATTYQPPSVNLTPPDFLTTNFGPSHAQNKSQPRPITTAVAGSPNSSSSNGSCCDECDPCSNATSLGSTNLKPITSPILTQQIANFASVANTPQPVSTDQTNNLNSQISQHNNHISANAYVDAANNAPYGPTPSSLPQLTGYIN